MLPGNLPEKLAQDALGAPPKAPLSHDNKALGKGGHMTFEYAISLARTGVSRDYVARALLARGVDPEAAKEIVETAFRAAGQHASRGASRALFAGICMIVAGIGLSVAVGVGGDAWSPLGIALITFGIAVCFLGANRK